MLKLNEFFENADINTFCKITDINGKVLIFNRSVYEISKLYEQYLEYHIISYSIKDNCLYIILDIDFKR